MLIVAANRIFERPGANEVFPGEYFHLLLIVASCLLTVCKCTWKSMPTYTNHSLLKTHDLKGTSPIQLAVLTVASDRLLRFIVHLVDDTLAHAGAASCRACHFLCVYQAV